MFHFRTFLLRLFAACVLLIPSASAFASHLVGGELGYVYLGPSPLGNGYGRYEIVLNLHINCNSQSEVPYFQQMLSESADGMLSAGIYIQDPDQPDADKLLFLEIDLPLLDSTTVQPEVPPGCTIGDDICLKKGVFRTVVDLPPSAGGYHLFSQLCCRIIGLANLSNPATDGIGYYAFIPPTDIPNTSPEFFAIPTPFPCIGDTTTYLNTASDADGDELVFSFAHPYLSLSNLVFAGDPLPTTLEWPLATASYVPNFSPTEPFGPTGAAIIDPATGISLYAPNNIGLYIVVVEVREYRNGQLIGISRRDVQVQSVSCGGPVPNTAPELSAGTALTYEIEAGANLCTDLVFTDAEGQALSLAAYGPILDPVLTVPTATLSAPITAPGSLTTTFCWNTSCDQGREQPYLFSTSVTDQGCPTKTIDVAFQVLVRVGPGMITGAAAVCANSSGYSYTIDDPGTDPPVWIVSGGTLTSGQGTDSITVDWGALGTGTITVTTTNSNGCTGGSVLNVQIGTTIPVDLGPAITLCSGDSVQLGAPATGNWTWTPVEGLSNANIADPMASPATSTLYTVNVSENGCTGSGSVQVDVVTAPVVDLGADLNLCNGDSVQLGTGGAGNWNWIPTNGLDDATAPAPMASPGNTTEYIAYVTLNGCTDSDTLLVVVTGNPSADAGPDAWLCTGSSITLDGVGGGSASWTPALGLDDPTSLTPLATPDVTTTYVLTITDGLGCSATDTTTITVGDDPFVDAGADLSLCVGQTANLQGAVSGGAGFAWSPVEGLDDATLLTPVASPSTTTLYTLTATVDTCTASDQVLVTVQTLGAEAFTFRVEPGCDSIRAFLRAEVGGADLLWDLGDGTTSTASSFQHYFQYGQPIVVSLTATDASGCSATSTVQLPTDTLPDLTDARAPNVFTPNGDGVNDVFSPLPENVGRCATLIVLNRWGQKVFESFGNNVRWDGHDPGGQVCVPGTYYYTFTLRELQWQGSVELIR
ncbi:MAG TPA: gliding motility-associated C-terminal domain-containing protein [Flavobacteriales bacterium]